MIYINDLISGTQPKFDAELAELRKIKAAETNDPKAQINVWDWRYFANQLKKQKYNVDAEALRHSQTLCAASHSVSRT